MWLTRSIHGKTTGYLFRSWKHEAILLSSTDHLHDFGSLDIIDMNECLGIWADELGGEVIENL